MSNSETGYITTSDYVNHPITTFNNNAILITDNSTPSDVLSTASMTDGQIVIGSSSGIPASANITAGSNIVITNGPNSITIDASGAGLGTVTSVGLTLPASVFSVSGSPVVTMGVLAGALINQAVNTFFAGPSTGASTSPTFRQIVAEDITALNTDGELLIGNSTNGYSSVSTLTAGTNISIINAPGSITISSANGTITLTGDVTGVGSTSIATTIAAHAVTFAKMQQVTGPVLLGLDTGTADIAALSTNSTIDLSGGTVKRAAITGDISIANNSNTSTINNGVVTYAKMQNETASTLLGNPTGSPAAPSEITLGSGLSFAGTVLNALFSGTVTSFSFTNANGVSGSVSNATTTPNLTISLGAITPTSVNGIVFSGSSTPTLAVTGTSSISGVNTGNQTITLTSDITGSGTGTFAATIANNAVTYAKFQQNSALSLVGNPTASLANNQAITLGAGLSFSGTTLVNSNPTAGVTSVALSAPVEFTVSGSPITGAGTLSFAKASQTQNLVYASPDGNSGVPVFRAITNSDLPSALISVGALNTTSTANALDYTGTVLTAHSGSSTNQGVGHIQTYNGVSLQNTSIGTTNFPLYSTTTTTKNTSIGTGGMGGSGSTITSTANNNTAIGYNTLNSITSARQCTAIGSSALQSVTVGANNTAIGFEAGKNIGGAAGCTIVGSQACAAPSTIIPTTAVGFQCLQNGTGTSQTAVGYQAGINCNSATNSCYFGSTAGNQATGNSNCLIGPGAASGLTSGNDNVVLGQSSLAAGNSRNVVLGNSNTSTIGAASENIWGYNITGSGSNTYTIATGGIPSVANTSRFMQIDGTSGQLSYAATQPVTSIGAVSTTSTANVLDITTGVLTAHVGSSANPGVGHIQTWQNSNAAVGNLAMPNFSTVSGTNNVAFGSSALSGITTTGASNVAIGASAGTICTTGSSNIYIGATANGSAATNTNEIVIGAATTGNGSNSLTVRLASVPVVVNTTISINTTTGQLTRISSSKRYKTPVSDDPNLSDMANALFSLQPRSYYYNADPKEQVRVGYYAEDLQDFVDSNGNHIFEPILNYIDLEDGNGFIPDDINYWMLVVPIIINQVALRAQIVSQASAIATLQAQVSALQSPTNIIPLIIPSDIPNNSVIGISDDGDVVKANSFNKMKNTVVGININGKLVSSCVVRIADNEVTASSWIKLKTPTDSGYSYWLIR